MAAAMSLERTQQAKDLHRGGDFAGAIEIYRQVLESEPAAADVWHLKGMAEHQSGQLAPALESARKAIAVGGAKAPYLLLEGSVLHDSGDLPGAEARFARAVTVAPKWAPAMMELGAVRLDLGRPHDAVEAFRAAVDADPKSVRGWNNLGYALLALDKVDDAIRAFDFAINLKPRNAHAHFQLARIYNTRNDHKVALRHAQAATQADATYMDAWLLVGDVQRRLKDMDAALEAYKSAAASVPDNLPALNAMADLLAEMGRFEEARPVALQDIAPLGREDQLGAPRRRLADQRRGLPERLGLRGRRPKLDQRNFDGHALSRPSSSPRRSRAKSSSHPPTWRSPMNIWGKVAPPERAIISPRLAGSKPASISFT